MKERYEVGVGARVYAWNTIRYLIIPLVIILLAVAVGNWALRWQGAALDTIGPERMQQLSREANDRWQSLEAQRTSIATQQARLAEFETLYGTDRATWPQGKREEYQQLSAAIRNLETAYNSACGQYKAMWADEWRDIPAPDDLPRTCE